MESSSGISSNSSEGDLKQVMDQRKRKRMISNRESARRSRLRKQKHLDELMTQVSQLRKENHEILTGLNVTTQHHLRVESDNAILRVQAAELSCRLQSLNEIVSFLAAGNDGIPAQEEPAYGMAEMAGFVNYSWNCSIQPIIMTAASADTGFMY